MVVIVSAAEGIDEQEASDYVLKLTANGRSNLEDNPADWGGVTTFKNMDWNTNGWLKKDGIDVLALTNGASAEIDYQPFVLTNEYSVERNGMTVEMEIMVSQVLQRGYRVVSCLDGTPALGFDITSEEANLHLGQMQNIVTAEEDDQGNKIVIARELGVAMNIATDKWMKVAFVIQPSVDGQRKTFLFINGVLSKANQYEQGLSFVQSNPKSITLTSEKADVYARSVRIYRRALSHSEILGNYIIDVLQLWRFRQSIIAMQLPEKAVIWQLTQLHLLKRGVVCLLSSVLMIVVLVSLMSILPTIRKPISMPTISTGILR